MATSARHAVMFALLVSAAVSLFADEIKLKDGKKLYGVIVAYEDNMFRIKTDFGFVLVEKDKIASIIPTSPGAATSATAGKPAKAPDKKPTPEPVATSAINSAASAAEPSDPPPAKPKL